MQQKPLLLIVMKSGLNQQPGCRPKKLVRPNGTGTRPCLGGRLQPKNNIKSIELMPRNNRWLRQSVPMKDEFKLAGAFLALNAAVITLATAGYIKSGMNLGAVLEHLK